MRPIDRDHEDDQSSDSDEEEKVRHDRFRSERFQDVSKKAAKNREREDASSNFDRYSSRRSRGRSPPRYYGSRGSNSSSSHHSEISRSNHDRRKKEHHSKSNKSDKRERTEENKNVAKATESRKKTLSSILKSFDDNLESKRKNVESEAKIGPALPPHLKEKHIDEKELQNSPLNQSDSVVAKGSALPPSVMASLDDSKIETFKLVDSQIKDYNTNKTPETPSTNNDKINDQIEGPALSPHLKQDINKDDSKHNSSLNQLSENASAFECLSSDDSCSVSLPKLDKASFGPVLPPSIEKDSYGPALPPNFKKDNIQGPTLPEGVTIDQLETLAQEESEDEDMVGPLPEGKMNMTQFQLDMRASHIKRKMNEEKCGTSQDIKKREEWMLELPPGKASNLGLGPRSFRMREAPDMSDRSSWTDTPADKLRKMEQALNGEPEPINPEELKRTAFIKERDDAMDKMAQLSREKDRPQSLLELHQKKIKKKKKKEEKEGKKKERRPFDRNIDLQVNRFDDAQKKAIFKKAQLLDTRFSTGESKYL